MKAYLRRIKAVVESLEFGACEVNCGKAANRETQVLILEEREAGRKPGASREEQGESLSAHNFS